MMLVPTIGHFLKNKILIVVFLLNLGCRVLEEGSSK